jgi:F0F1-type ATP synthase gamma subunit
MGVGEGLFIVLHFDLEIIAGAFELGSAPTTKEAQAVADQLYSEFVSEDVDKVELIFSKFVSLINSEPSVQTMLPLTPQVPSRTLQPSRPCFL